jgi:5S rRNA maturation endonuclease (ribonuclease M5)
MRTKAYIKKEKEDTDFNTIFARLPSVIGTPGQKYLEGRGIHIGTMRHFDIRWDGRSVVYPIRDASGVVGICRQEPGKKAINDKGMDKKWMFGAIESTLYWADWDTYKPFILVEGPIDCLKVYQAGYSGGAMLGANVTNSQLMQMLSISTNVYLFPDKDAAGKLWLDKVIEWLVKNVCILPRIVIAPGDLKDAGECTEKEIQDAVDNAVQLKLIIGGH